MYRNNSLDEIDRQATLGYEQTQATEIELTDIEAVDFEYSVVKPEVSPAALSWSNLSVITKMKAGLFNSEGEDFFQKSTNVLKSGGFYCG